MEARSLALAKKRRVDLPNPAVGHLTKLSLSAPWSRSGLARSLSPSHIVLTIMYSGRWAIKAMLALAAASQPCGPSKGNLPPKPIS
jgi:hypothetical protein